MLEVEADGRPSLGALVAGLARGEPPCLGVAVGDEQSRRLQRNPILIRPGSAAVSASAILRRKRLAATLLGVEATSEPLIYRNEVLAIIGALADLVVEVREIRQLLDENDDEEQEE